MTELSKTQIDKLGERLKKGNVTEADLRLLDEYRLSFSAAYQFVEESLREQLKLEPTGRPAKSTPSIVEKLKRESIRLTQMQDIAGCRLIVDFIPRQNEIVEALKQLFAVITIVDRRIRPIHGYRAVHAIINHNGKLVEIQIRTKLQHSWAELCEKMADRYGPGLKYGSGPPDLVRILLRESAVAARVEALHPGKMIRDQEDPSAEEIDSFKTEYESAELEVTQAAEEFMDLFERDRND